MKIAIGQNKQRRLWKCPKCGERFVTRKMWHSCGKFSLADLFARSEPQVLLIFRAFARMVRNTGPAHMIPQKTRVVFQTRMRFAGAMPRKSHLLCTFILPREVKSVRMRKILKFSPHCYLYHLPVRSVAELDNNVARWLKEAYAVGDQKYVRQRKR